MAGNTVQAKQPKKQVIRIEDVFIDDDLSANEG
jgi:hypothetical protein